MTAATAPAALEKLTVQNREYTVLPYDPTNPNTQFLYIESRVLSLIGGMLRSGQPVALLGETGSAKTELARALMRRIKIDAFYQMEFGGVVSGDQLDGTFVLTNGSTVHYPSEHLKAVRLAADGKRIGYVQDELNRGSAFGLNKLLRLYAQWEYVSDLDGVLKVDPHNLLTIATLNVGFGFTGTTRVDTAIANRYRAVKLESPPAEILARIITERFSGIDQDVVRGIVKIYTASRSTEDSYRLGVRDAIGLAEGVMHGGCDLVSAVELLIGGAATLNGLPDEAVEALITTAKSVSKR
jgi:MoxR-like ATPase